MQVEFQCTHLTENKLSELNNSSWNKFSKMDWELSEGTTANRYLEWSASTYKQSEIFRVLIQSSIFYMCSNCLQKVLDNLSSLWQIIVSTFNFASKHFDIGHIQYALHFSGSRQEDALELIKWNYQSVFFLCQWFFN